MEMETVPLEPLLLLHPIIVAAKRIAIAAAACFMRTPEIRQSDYGAVTVSVAAGLLTVPTEALITVIPGAIPLASPLVPTIATPAELLCHVNVTPLTVFPLASKALAVNC